MKAWRLWLAILPIASGCATYNYAQNIKTVGFEDNIKRGTSAGNIRGEDCTWSVLGYQLGGSPTVDRAFINAKNQASALEAAGFDNTAKSRAPVIRYVNNVSTENDGFNVGLLAKNCIVVKGVGYK